MATERENAKKHGWWTERDAIAIVKTSSTDTTTSYVSPSEIKQVNVHAIKYDENFVASGAGITMSESPSIPDEFHSALASFAIAKGYELKPEMINLAGYFKQDFNNSVLEGKKYANKDRDGSGFNIKGHDF